ncbi:short-chain dehydrogenase [Sphingomonas sp. Leaf231]|uniref:SDR family oxidoreductase n=1 Tax=Sphingomonas sp. Leaf231 TaxID=1736301 RepID=UPI0006F5E0FD|nr:SDR family oxidoreductase [Sphingomonas sp. Leaf231]KQN93909.1 short-chain dehydrogenase [Sphingomonas sp. Leaf231]
MTDVCDAHTEMLPLKGRRAAITGGTTGIGRAIARLLAAEGAQVFIGGVDQTHLGEALADIREVGQGDGATLDLSQPDNVGAFLDAATQAMGGYDIVVANAAEAASGLTEMDEAEVRHAISLNFTHYLLLAHRAATTMGEGGDIVMIGSTSAYVLGPHSTVYAAIKHGLQGFSIALRRELGSKDIRVALVEPGKTGSDMQMPDVSPEEQREQINAGQMLRAEDIAVGVHYLLTQPRRTVIQRLTISPRVQEEE